MNPVRACPDVQARPPRARLRRWVKGLFAARWDISIRRPIAVAIAAAALLACVPDPIRAQGVPPDADWLTFETEHFRISFTEGLDLIARRAADRAEWSYRLLAEEFVDPPDGKIEILLSDNVDFANGNATPFPRNRIIAYMQPPASETTLAYHDDWLQLLLLHELVHIFHFDHAESIWSPLRRVFGRDPFLFPQIFSPGWIVEGLGTYFESAYTRGGRVRGSMFDMILRTAILEDEFFAIDRATIDPATWPGGSTRYIYGSLFINHLARRHGPEAIADFVASIGRQLIPYRMEAAARSAFGTTLAREWSAWEDSLRSEYTAVADSLRRRGLTQPEILSRGGRIARYPRYSPDSRRIAFAASTGREDAAILILDGAGSTTTAADRISLGPASWSGPDELLYAQLDFAGPYRLFSDLYRVRLRGIDRQVTERARVWEPHPHPDGRTAVAVANFGGTNVLVTVDLATGESTPLTRPDLDTYWSSPRWSPSGDRIAVSRWREGGLYDVVILDADGRVVREVTRDRAVDSAPSWSPDGRFVLFTSDRTGIPNLFAFDTESERLWQVTNVLTGAFDPEVSPDGRWIAFSYYRSDGYYIARIPYDSQGWTSAEQPLPRFADPTTVAESPQPVDVGPVRRYSPWPTLLPTRWAVSLAGDTDVGFGIGVGLSGVDVVQKHAWDLQIVGYPDGPRLDAAAGYRYRGWGNPMLDLRAQQEWDLQVASVTGTNGAGEATDLLRRDRESEAVLSWVTPTWEANRLVQVGLDIRKVDFLWRDPEVAGDQPLRRYPLDLGARVGLGYSSARAYELSLGLQDGVSAAGRVEARRYLEAPAWDPESRNYWRATAETRAFRGIDWFGFAPPVLALRLEGGIETAAGTPGFSLGGLAGQQIGLADGLDLLTGGVDYPVRGFSPGVQSGTRVLSASAEYRFPIVLVERGFRLLPLALDRIWGDLFVDAGTAWCPDPCAAGSGRPSSEPDPLIAIGAEGIVELRVGFFANLPLRAGAAFPIRTNGSRTPTFYLGVGPSF